MGAGFGPSDEKGGVVLNDFVIFDEAHEILMLLESWAWELVHGQWKWGQRIYNSNKERTYSSNWTPLLILPRWRMLILQFLIFSIFAS